MRDQLEDFVRDNRHEFDNKEPSERVWENIYSRLNQERNTGVHWIWKAAAVLFFLTSSFLLYRLEFSQSPDLITSNREVLTSDFRSVESFYVQEISAKKELISDFQEDNVRLNGNLDQDLRKLDAMYAVLKDEFETNPSKKVVDALILNLLVRVDILNDALRELEEESKVHGREANI